MAKERNTPEGMAAGDGIGGARILIVDDEESIRQFVSRALQLSGHGFTVDTAEDGLQALEALAAAPYELLVTDIVMPGLDGIELALKVAKDHPATAIMLMTGYASEKQRAYGLDRLIHKVVSKPFSLKQICAAVEEVLASR